MCPFCLASMGLVVAGAVSTGGLAALAVNVSLNRSRTKEIVPNSNQRRNQDVNEHNRESENSVAR
jgi:hypothetical protein